ncbi:MAG: ATPase, T2SS/T4P/T4SS family [Chthoniobacterales bacterium]|jgi:type II secretion system protein E|nr:ATPase, T2SS/T4P/T4SS family [Chthoniobacterales bacterium]
MPANDEYVIEILKDVGLMSQEQADDLSGRTGGLHMVETLIKEGTVSAEDVARTLASQNGMDFVDLSLVTPSPELINLLSPETARRYKTVPVSEHDGSLVLAIADPMDFEAFDSIGFLLKRPVEFVCAVPTQIHDKLDRLYPQGLEELGKAVVTEEEEDYTGDDDAPIIRLVSSLLIEAQNHRASDIHIEPMEKRLRIRYRIDGNLQEMQSPPKKLQGAIISRLKIMTASMNIAEKRIPQDGRIQIKMGEKTIDLRVSSVPTVHGESIVMRILDKSSLMLGLPELGFMSDDQATFERLVQMPDGIILVTGPTGSGKTTTLYGCLNYMNRPDRKIITVEEPVEYQMTGINQVQVNAEVGMTFAAALRSMLRQAPNIVMLGEIRDKETAEIAINASLTGHLVLSTLHTNDAPAAVARLVDIGVQPFLVSSAVRGIIAQRLVRKLCANCKVPGEMSEYEARVLNLDASQLSKATLMRAVGCEKCRGKGFRGRMGIFEIFVADDEIRQMINRNATTLQLRHRTREMGMRTLREDGIRKVLAGLTTPEEVISSTMGESH